MWFKNLIVYRFTEIPKQISTTNDTALDDALAATAFHPCGKQQLSSYGWVAPLKPLSESLTHRGSGFIFLQAQKEERILPASVIRDFVNDRVTQIEDTEARKVRRKEKNDIKEAVILELTPKAFTRSHVISALLAPKLGLLIVDASSTKKAEELTEYLRKSLGSLAIKPLQLNTTPTTLMTAWLDEKTPLPDDVIISDECELHSTDEDGAVVRCRKQDLYSKEIKTHLAASKVVVKLALEWDERLSFLLSDDFSLRKLRFSDLLQEQANDDGAGDKAAEFDAQFTLMSLELAQFLPRLIDIFGGETKVSNII